MAAEQTCMAAVQPCTAAVQPCTAAEQLVSWQLNNLLGLNFGEVKWQTTFLSIKNILNKHIALFCMFIFHTNFDFQSLNPFEDSEQKDHLPNELTIHKAVYRTSPTTPGLLNNLDTT